MLHRLPDVLACCTSVLIDLGPVDGVPFDFDAEADDETKAEVAQRTETYRRHALVAADPASSIGLRVFASQKVRSAIIAV
jgi:hypothetical protein